MAQIHTGHCLCGGVSYRVTGPLRAVTACHCSQCRRTSGHFVAMTSAPIASITLLSSTSLRWFASSAQAERGFCTVCGGNLFWRDVGGQEMSIAAGTLDPPTGLGIAKHIFVADKGDYYDLADGASQSPQG